MRASKNRIRRANPALTPNKGQGILQYCLATQTRAAWYWTKRRARADINISCYGKITAKLQHFNVTQEQIAVNCCTTWQNIFTHILQIQAAVDTNTIAQNWCGTTAVDYNIAVKNLYL